MMFVDFMAIFGGGAGFIALGIMLSIAVAQISNGDR